MQQTVESLGALERRIDLTVPAEAIDKEVQTRLNKLARTVKMPGFRPGKVPLKMVAQTYGAQVHAEVLNDKVGEAFSSAVSAGNLRVAGAPRLEPRTLEGSQDLAFSAAVRPIRSCRAAKRYVARRASAPARRPRRRPKAWLPRPIPARNATSMRVKL